jgi:biopolymer transport protein ExbB
LKTAIQLTLQEGGLTLYALLALAVAIYSICFSVWLHLRSTKATVKQQNNFAEIASPRELQRSFAGLELDEMAWVERRLPFLSVLITAAPLLGLLGTVAGMLVTFSGMATGTQAPIDTISKGISQALVTTQAGLIIAIPAAFFLALLKRQAETTHLELQRQLHHHLSQTSPLRAPRSTP